MPQDVWKWVLEILPDEELIKIVKATKVKIPGFRTISSTNIKKIRPQAIQHTLITLNKMKNHSITLEGNDDGDTWDGLREKSKLELEQDIEQGADLIEVFLALLTSSDMTHHTTAQLIFDSLSTNGELEKFRERHQEVITQEEQKNEENIKQDELTKKYGELDKKLKRSQEKNDDLKEQISKQKSEFDSKYKALQKETESLRNELVQLKQLYKSLQSQSENDEERAKWQSEREELQKTINKQQEEIKRLKDISITSSTMKTDVSPMAAAFAKAQFVLPAIKGSDDEKDGILTNHSHAKLSSVTVSRPPLVALVAKQSKTNDQICQSLRYEIKLIEPNEIDTSLQDETRFEEIWLLNYEVNLGQKRKLQKKVQSSKLKVFSTFKQLTDYTK